MDNNSLMINHRVVMVNFSPSPELSMLIYDMFKDKITMTINKTRRSTMRPQATFSFFIFLQLFHFFTLLVAPSSSSLLPPRPSFLLVPLSSLSLFLPRPELSESFRIRKRPFFTEFDESVTDQPTNGPTDQRTDKASYRDARTHLKSQ